MKTAMCALTLTLLFAGHAMAADLCRAKALSAAEDDYGNDPRGTTVRTVVPGQSYIVSVGRDNDEDGEHTYSVIFQTGCQGQPLVTELTNIAQ